MEQNFGGSVAGLMTGLLSDAAFFPRSHTAASTSKVRLPLGLRPVETLRRKPHKPMVRTCCGELIALASLVAGLLNSMTASSPVKRPQLLQLSTYSELLERLSVRGRFNSNGSRTLNCVPSGPVLKSIFP